MNLSVQQYLEWKRQGLSDAEIMKTKIFYRNKRALTKWKKENGIPLGAQLYYFKNINLKDVRKMRKTMSYQQIANHYGVTYSSLYDWVLKQRKNGQWV